MAFEIHCMQIDKSRDHEKFDFVQTDFPIGGTRRDKTNWAAQTCKRPVSFSSR